MEEAMMRTLLLAGAAALVFTGSALAKPGNGHGNGHGNGNGKANTSAYAYGTQGPVGYGAGGCPRGLAKKAIPCVPPGQAKKQYNVGQRLPQGYGTPYSYNQIPSSLRTQQSLNRNQNYYYQNGYLYGVDPRTMQVRRALAARLR
jgi:hypothetical protein